MNFNTVACLNRAGTFNIAMDEPSYTSLLDLATLDLQRISIKQGLAESYPSANIKIFGKVVSEKVQLNALGSLLKKAFQQSLNY